MLFETACLIKTTPGLPNPYPYSGSSRNNGDEILEALDWLISNIKPSKFPSRGIVHPHLRPQFEIDPSSIYWCIASKTETLEIEGTDEMNSDIPIEYDINIRMPPIRRYTRSIIITKRKKAKPRVIVPEE